MGEITWNVKTYETGSGEKVVDEFIKKQQPQAKAKMVHTVKLLRLYGEKKEKLDNDITSMLYCYYG